MLGSSVPDLEFLFFVLRTQNVCKKNQLEFFSKRLACSKNNLQEGNAVSLRCVVLREVKHLEVHRLREKREISRENRKDGPK
jgi:hypothetical protein